MTASNKANEQQKIDEIVRYMWISMVIGVVLGVAGGALAAAGYMQAEYTAKYLYLGCGLGLAVIAPILWRHAMKKTAAKYKTVDEMLKKRPKGHGAT